MQAASTIPNYSCNSCIILTQMSFRRSRLRPPVRFLHSCFPYKDAFLHPCKSARIRDCCVRILDNSPSRHESFPRRGASRGILTPKAGNPAQSVLFGALTCCPAMSSKVNGLRRIRRWCPHCGTTPAERHRNCGAIGRSGTTCRRAMFPGCLNENRF
jgi:hypothetical protein